MRTQDAILAESKPQSIVWLRWLTIIIWLYWIIVYWNGGKKGVDHSREAWKFKESHLDLLAMSSITAFSVPLIGSLIAIVLRRELDKSPSFGSTSTLIGMLLTGSGVAGMSVSRAYLGQFWTTQASIQSEHDIVNQGPYGWVRHPIYTSALGIYTGTALVFPKRTIVALAIMVCLSYALKTQAEEELLIEHIPGYKDYQAQVRFRLLPGLW